MKALLLAAATLMVASHASASLRAARCNTENPQTAVTVNVIEGDEVSVIIDNVNPSTGYNVVSAEGIEGKFWRSTSAVRPGAGGKMTFRFKADDQKQTTATYTFEYKRSWEKKAPASICLVTVVKK